MNRDSSTFRIGAIGVDSSHLPEFTKRVLALHESARARCLVTRLWTDGKHDLREEQAQQWLKSAVAMGVKPARSIDELLDDVDGVMVLAVNGNKHLEFALPGLKRGLPTYIDKPLTCSLDEARQLLTAARGGNARCFSASSLRFAAEVTDFPREQLGTLCAIDAFGPGELIASMPGLFFYGVHAIEMVDALWGPGVRRVRAVTTADRDLVDLAYHDGRCARLRMERAGAYEFGATIHGQKQVHQFRVDFSGVYNRMIERMTHFFEGGPAPVPLRDTIENIAVMEAGNRSMAADGEWIDVANEE